MNMRLETNSDKQYVKLIIAMLVASLLYKISVPSSANMSIFSLLMDLPFSSVSAYTKTISILHFPLLGICAQCAVLIFAVFLLRGKLTIRPKSLLFWVEIIILIRIVSYLMFSQESFSAFYILEQVWLLMTAICIGGLKINDSQSLSKKVLMFFEVLGLICAITAIIYFFQISGGQIVVFRRFRIAGIYTEAVGVTFIYGLAVYGALLRLVSRAGKKTLFTLMELAIITVGGLMSGSRSFIVFIALAVISVAWSTRGHKVWILIVVISILGLAACLFMDDMFVIDIKTMTDVARFQKLRVAADTFLKHPLFGVGTSNYGIYEAVAGLKGTNPHNMALEILSENGLVGIAAYMILIVKTVLSLLTGPQKAGRASAVCIAFWFIISMIVGVLSSQFMMICLIVFVFIIDNKPLSSDNRLHARAVPQRIQARQ